MTLSLQQAAEARAEQKRMSRCERGKRDLWWLMTEVGGIAAVPGLVGRKSKTPSLSETFHKPMIREMDLMRRARLEGRGGKDVCSIWPREFCKTTVMTWQTIQDLLWDPADTIVWWHAVEEMAERVCHHTSTLLQTHRPLRALFPAGSLPSTNAKRFISGTRFTMPANKSGIPTFRAWGWNSEATGGHARRGKLDDVIARSTIEDSALPKVKRWYQNTVKNVVQANGWCDAAGTRWDSFDIYADWLASKYWDVTVRAAIEKDGVGDKAGEPTFMDMDLIRKKMDEMGPDFDPQMMNDPVPPGEIPWKPHYEQHITLKEADGPGFVVVLGDPAPAMIGSLSDRGAKQRGDGTKNRWCWAVVKLRRNGMRREIILLDLSSSKEWTVDEGFDEACRLQRRWQTASCAYESTGNAIAAYDKSYRDACRRNGARCSPVKLSWTYKGKNAYWGKFCSRAQTGEFLIADTVPEEEQEIFLDQARRWRPISGLTGSGNGLRFDDHANVVSFSVDPEVELRSPRVEEGFAWSPFIQQERDEPEVGTRYIRW